MIAEAIDKILSFKTETIHEIDGRKWCGSKMYPFVPPSPKSVEIHTLDGVIRWMETEEIDFSQCIIWIPDWNSVSCSSIVDELHRTRHHYLDCTNIGQDRFPFNQFIELERFIIELQCKFESNDDKAALLEIAGNIRSEEVSQTSDDGISQEIIVANKIGRMEKKKVSPMFKLAPFRTFVDVQQPVSKFLFRLKKGGKEKPLAGLFEADGGKWKTQSILNIKQWFDEQPLIKQYGIHVIG